MHPVLNRPNAPIARPQAAEFRAGELVQAIGLAIAARVDVGQRLGRKLRDRHFLNAFGRCDVMGNVDSRVIVHRQAAGVGTQARVSVAMGRIGEQGNVDRLAHQKILRNQRLALRLRGVDVEYEVAGVIGDFVRTLDEAPAGSVAPQGWKHAFASRSAQAFANAHPAAVRAILPTYTKIPVTAAPHINLGLFPPTMNAAQLQRVANLMLSGGMLTTRLDVQPLLFH